MKREVNIHVAKAEHFLLCYSLLNHSHNVCSCMPSVSVITCLRRLYACLLTVFSVNLCDRPYGRTKCDKAMIAETILAMVAVVARLKKSNFLDKKVCYLMSSNQNYTIY